MPNAILTPGFVNMPNVILTPCIVNMPNAILTPCIVNMPNVILTPGFVGTRCAAKDHNTAATMRFAFKSADGSSYFPIAGQMYSAKGPVSENEALWGIPKE
jgi:hypothetical protein